jgi:hypothetical protein
VEERKEDETFLELGLLLIVTGLWWGVVVIASSLVVFAKESNIRTSWLLILVSACPFGALGRHVRSDPQAEEDHHLPVKAIGRRSQAD